MNHNTESRLFQNALYSSLHYNAHIFEQYEYLCKELYRDMIDIESVKMFDFRLSLVQKGVSQTEYRNLELNGVNIFYSMQGFHAFPMIKIAIVRSSSLVVIGCTFLSLVTFELFYDSKMIRNSFESTQMTKTNFFPEKALMK